MFQVYIIYLVSFCLSLDLFIDNLFEVWTALWMGTKEKMMHEDIPMHIIGHTNQAYE